MFLKTIEHNTPSGSNCIKGVKKRGGGQRRKRKKEKEREQREGEGVGKENKKRKNEKKKNTKEYSLIGGTCRPK